MSGSHALDRWLISRETELRSAGVTAKAERGPMLAGRESPTWISFETPRSAGRVVLWNSGRCQLDASSHDGIRLCATEREVTTPAELDEAVTHLVGLLAGASAR